MDRPALPPRRSSCESTMAVAGAVHGSPFASEGLVSVYRRGSSDAGAVAAAGQSYPDLSLSATVVVAPNSHDSSSTAIVHRTPHEPHASAGGVSPLALAGVARRPSGASSVERAAPVTESDTGSFIVHQTPASGPMTPCWAELLARGPDGEGGRRRRGQRDDRQSSGDDDDDHHHSDDDRETDTDDDGDDNNTVDAKKAARRAAAAAAKAKRKRRRRKHDPHGEPGATMASLQLSRNGPSSLRDRLILEQRLLSRKQAKLDAEKLKRQHDSHGADGLGAADEIGAAHAQEGSGYSPSPDRPAASGRSSHGVRASIVGPTSIAGDATDDAFFYLHRDSSSDDSDAPGLVEAADEHALSPWPLYTGTEADSRPRRKGTLANLADEDPRRPYSLASPVWRSTEAHPSTSALTSPPNASFFRGSVSVGNASLMAGNSRGLSASAGAAEQSGWSFTEAQNNAAAAVAAALSAAAAPLALRPSVSRGPLPLTHLFSQGALAVAVEEASAYAPLVDFDGLLRCGTGAAFDVLNSTAATPAVPGQMAPPASTTCGLRASARAMRTPSRCTSPVSGALDGPDSTAPVRSCDTTTLLLGSPGALAVPPSSRSATTDEAFASARTATGAGKDKRPRRSRLATAVLRPPNSAAGAGRGSPQWLFSPLSVALDGSVVVGSGTRRQASPSAPAARPLTTVASLLTSPPAAPTTHSMAKEKLPTPLQSASTLPIGSADRTRRPPPATSVGGRGTAAEAPALPAELAGRNVRQWTTLITGTLMENAPALPRAGSLSPVKSTIGMDGSRSSSVGSASALTSAGAASSLRVPRRSTGTRLTVRVFTVTAGALLDMAREASVRSGDKPRLSATVPDNTSGATPSLPSSLCAEESAEDEVDVAETPVTSPNSSPQHWRSATTQPRASTPTTANHRYAQSFVRPAHVTAESPLDDTALAAPTTVRATLRHRRSVTSSHLCDVVMIKEMADVTEEKASAARRVQEMVDHFDPLFLPSLETRLKTLLSVTGRARSGSVCARRSSSAAPVAEEGDTAPCVRAADSAPTAASLYLTLPVLGLQLQMVPFRQFAAAEMGEPASVSCEAAKDARRDTVAPTSPPPPPSSSTATAEKPKPKRHTSRPERGRDVHEVDSLAIAGETSPPHALATAARQITPGPAATRNDRYGAFSPSASSSMDTVGDKNNSTSHGDGPFKASASPEKPARDLGNVPAIGTSEAALPTPPVAMDTPVLAVAVAYPTVLPGNVRTAFREWVTATKATPVEREFIIRNIVHAVLRRLAALHATGCAHGSVKSTNVFAVAHVAQALMATNQDTVGPVTMAAVRAAALVAPVRPHADASASSSLRCALTPPAAASVGVPAYTTALVTRCATGKGGDIARGLAGAAKGLASGPLPSVGEQTGVHSRPSASSVPGSPTSSASPLSLPGTVRAGDRRSADGTFPRAGSEPLPGTTAPATVEVDVDGAADIFRWSTEMLLADEMYATVEHAVRCAVADVAAAVAGAEDSLSTAPAFAFPTSTYASPSLMTLPVPLGHSAGPALATSMPIASARPPLPSPAVAQWLQTSARRTSLFPLTEAEAIPPPEYIRREDEVDEKSWLGGIAGAGEKDETRTSPDWRHAALSEDERSPDENLAATGTARDGRAASLPAPLPEYPYRLRSLNTDAPQPLRSVAGDVWMLGMLAIELADGPVPVEQKQRRRPRPSLRYRPWSSHFAGFVRRCVADDPNDRPSCAALLDDPWFTVTLAATATAAATNASNESERVLSLLEPPRGYAAGSLVRRQRRSTTAPIALAAEQATAGAVALHAETFAPTKLYLKTAGDVCRQFRHHALDWLRTALAAARRKRSHVPDMNWRRARRPSLSLGDNPALAGGGRTSTFVSFADESQSQPSRQESQSAEAVQSLAPDTSNTASPAQATSLQSLERLRSPLSSALSKSSLSPHATLLSTQAPTHSIGTATTPNTRHSPLSTRRRADTGPAGDGSSSGSGGDDDDDDASSQNSLMRTLPMPSTGHGTSATPDVLASSSAAAAEKGLAEALAAVSASATAGSPSAATAAKETTAAAASSSSSSTASSASLFDAPLSVWTPSDEEDDRSERGPAQPRPSRRCPALASPSTPPSITLSVVTTALELCRRQAQLEEQLFRRHGGALGTAANGSSAPVVGVARRGSSASTSLLFGAVLNGGLGSVSAESPLHGRGLSLPTPLSVPRARSDSLPTSTGGASLTAWLPTNGAMAAAAVLGSPSAHTARHHDPPLDTPGAAPASPISSCASTASSFFLYSDDEEAVAAELAQESMEDGRRTPSTMPAGDLTAEKKDRETAEGPARGASAVPALGGIQFERPPPILLRFGDPDEEEDVLDASESEKQLTNILQAFLSLYWKHPLAADTWCFQILRHLSKDTRTAELARELETLLSPSPATGAAVSPHGPHSPSGAAGGTGPPTLSRQTTSASAETVMGGAAETTGASSPPPPPVTPPKASHATPVRTETAPSLFNNFEVSKWLLSSMAVLDREKEYHKQLQHGKPRGEPHTTTRA